MKDINLYLNLSEEEIKKVWESHGFTYEEAKEWMEVGFEPSDCGFVFLFKEKGYTPQRIRNCWQLGLNNLNGLKDSLFDSEAIRERKGREIICLKWELNQKENQLIQERKKVQFLNEEVQGLQKKLDKQRHILGEQTNGSIPKKERQLAVQLRQKTDEITKIKADKLKLETKNKELQKNILFFKEGIHLESGKIEKSKQTSSEYFSLFQERIKKLQQENQELRHRLIKREVQEKQSELEKWKNSLKDKLDKELHDELDDLLEAQEEFAKSSNNFAQKQLEKNKHRLKVKGNLTEQEIENICKIQEELTKLEIETKEKVEAKIEIIA